MFHALQSTLEGRQAAGCNYNWRPWRPIGGDDPPVGMMIRGTPQARIMNHRITNQGVKPVNEGKDARVAGASVTYAAIRYRNAAKATRKRGQSPLKDEVARARAGLLLSAAAAWHPLWLKWRASLGERTCQIHPSRRRKPAWGRCSRPPSASVSP